MKTNRRLPSDQLGFGSDPNREELGLCNCIENNSLTPSGITPF